jgi:hypothetical protein
MLNTLFLQGEQAAAKELPGAAVPVDIEKVDYR